ncbi:MAG: DNA polymerase III subunit delta [Nitrospirota bacterium]
MLNKSLSKELANGLPGTLYYLWSEESCFLEEALSKVIEIVVDPGTKDFNYDQFDSSSEPQGIIDASSTLPFMTQRRLVVIKDFHLFKTPVIKKIMPGLNDLPESTCMVVLSQKAPRASLKADWKTFSLNIKEYDVPVWLKQKAAEKGIKLTDDAVDNLIDFVGYEIGLLLMEIEKLSLAGNKTVTGKDIVSTTSMMRNYTPFDLLDSLISGRKSRAFSILKTILGKNVMEATVILGTLNWHFKQFHTLWLNRGKRPMKMRTKTYNILRKHLSSFNENDFFRIFESLHEADLRIKTSGRPGLVLEVLLIKLLQKGAWS